MLVPGAAAPELNPRVLTALLLRLGLASEQVGDECVLLDMTLGEGALEEGGAAIAELLKVGREAKTNRGQIEGKKEVVTWSEPTSAEQEKGVLLKIAHSKPLIQVGVWCVRSARGEMSVRRDACEERRGRRRRAGGVCVASWNGRSEV